MDHTRRKTRAASVSVISNMVLILGKVAAGLAIGSVSILSEAIHSGVDLIAALIALTAVRVSGKAADRDHPFGHGKAENVAGTVEAVLIFGAAIWIIWEAIDRLRHPAPMGHLGWGVAVMGISAVVNLLVSRWLMRVGKETDSVALQADAVHLSTDVWTSFGVMAGLALIWLGQLIFPGTNLDWLDPVCAMAVAVLILHAAWELTRQAGRDLFDARLSDEEESSIRTAIERTAPEACELHDLRTRRAGAQRFVELHLVVPGEMTVEASHAATDRAEAAIEAIYPGTHVSIHVEPCSDRARCGEACRRGVAARA